MLKFAISGNGGQKQTEHLFIKTFNKMVCYLLIDEMDFFIIVKKKWNSKIPYQETYKTFSLIPLTMPVNLKASSLFTK